MCEGRPEPYWHNTVVRRLATALEQCATGTYAVATYQAVAGQTQAWSPQADILICRQRPDADALEVEPWAVSVAVLVVTRFTATIDTSPWGTSLAFATGCIPALWTVERHEFDIPQHSGLEVKCFTLEGEGPDAAYKEQSRHRRDLILHDPFPIQIPLGQIWQ